MLFFRLPVVIKTVQSVNFFLRYLFNTVLLDKIERNIVSVQSKSTEGKLLDVYWYQNILCFCDVLGHG
jgi:hypothetical protein